MLSKRARSVFRSAIVPIVIIAVWEILVRAGVINPLILPAPSRVPGGVCVSQRPHSGAPSDSADRLRPPGDPLVRPWQPAGIFPDQPRRVFSSADEYDRRRSQRGR